MPSINEVILAELHTHVKSEMSTTNVQQYISKIVKKVLNQTGIESTTVIRRSYDGCSEADWLIEKMIGEYLQDHRINW